MRPSVIPSVNLAAGDVATAANGFDQNGSPSSSLRSCVLDGTQGVLRDPPFSLAVTSQRTRGRRPNQPVCGGLSRPLTSLVVPKLVATPDNE